MAERSLEGDLQESRAMWDRVAEDWHIQVGDRGDDNRRLNSDPVLFDLVGEVAGKAVLDAGCGNGYLARLLRERGASVTAIDASERMVAIARAQHPDLDVHVDSCSTLATLEDGRFDVVVANYVLMDTPDLPGTMAAFHRVLKAGGVAVLVFSHPCFPQGRARRSADGATLAYDWDFPYFEPAKLRDPPWAHFTSDFIWYHRPLSAYWKAFRAAGFAVEDFDEPRIAPDRYALAPSAEALAKSLTRPYSVAFKLRKVAKEG